MMARDLNKTQFVAAMRRNGFSPELLGFWRIKDTGISIHPRNGGTRRRDQLSWAIAERDRILGQGTLTTEFVDGEYK